MCLMKPSANDIRFGFSKAREDWNADTAHFKTLTLDRLNELFKIAWPISLTDTPEADVAFSRVMKVMELELQIHGLLPYFQDHDEVD